MKKRKFKYPLPILPTDMILLLDNCCFQLDDYERRYRRSDSNNPSLDYLKADYLRLEGITGKLSSMNNWTTTKNILKQFRTGNYFFKMMGKKAKCKQSFKIHKKIYLLRRDFLILLEQDYRLIDYNLNPELIRIKDNNKEFIRKIFEKNKRDYKGKKTDIELINFALAYAIQDPPSCIFSQDHNLLKTFIRCSKKICLSDKTFCLADKLQRPVKTKDIRDNYF